jgi:hypothetical protein
MLDEEARRAYGERLRDLEALLAEAEAHHDSGRALRLSTERDFLVSELRRAVGLGGRARRANSANERARTAVQRRIRAAIERIAQAAPVLGQALQESIRTGTFCVYEPRRMR